MLINSNITVRMKEHRRATSPQTVYLYGKIPMVIQPRFVWVQQLLMFDSCSKLKGDLYEVLG